MQQIILIFEKFFKQSWWVILFGILSFMLFENSMKTHNSEFSKLQEQFHELEKQKKEALALHEKLMREFNSQSDPAWIELVLMKGLGLIREGQIKVFFDNSAIRNP